MVIERKGSNSDSGKAAEHEVCGRPKRNELNFGKKGGRGRDCYWTAGRKTHAKIEMMEGRQRQGRRTGQRQGKGKIETEDGRPRGT